METKTAIITYGVADEETKQMTIPQFFGKKEEEFFPKIESVLDNKKHASITADLTRALDEGVLDGSDVMILAAIGLRTLYQQIEMSTIAQKFQEVAAHVFGCDHNCEECDAHEEEEDDEEEEEGEDFDDEENEEA